MTRWQERQEVRLARQGTARNRLYSDKVWRTENAEHRRSYKRAWAARNPERVAGYTLQWLGKNPGVSLFTVFVPLSETHFDLAVYRRMPYDDLLEREAA